MTNEKLSNLIKEAKNYQGRVVEVPRIAKQGQLIFWWSSNFGGFECYVDTLAEAIILNEALADFEVNNEDVEYNVSGVISFDRQNLEPCYECEDGYMDVFMSDGQDFSDVKNMVHDEILESNVISNDKSLNNISVVIEILKKLNIEGEIPEIKIY